MVRGAVEKSARLEQFPLAFHRMGFCAIQVHHIHRHLNCVELKLVAIRHFEHVQVNAGVLVTREADVPNLTRLLKRRARLRRRRPPQKYGRGLRSG